MSGPATVSYSLGPLGAIILAEAALREARAAGQEYNAIMADRAERSRRLQARRGEAVAAAKARGEGLREAVHGLCNTVQTLGRLAGELGDEALAAALNQALTDHTPLLENDQATPPEMAAALRALEEVEAAARARLTSRPGENLVLPELPEPIRGLSRPGRTQPAISPARAADVEGDVARILGRLPWPLDEPWPAALLELAEAVRRAPEPERRGALLSELRHQVQDLSRDLSREGALAADWLQRLESFDVLPDAVVAQLCQADPGLADFLAGLKPEAAGAAPSWSVRLAQVVAGERRLAPEMARRLEADLPRAEAALARRGAEAAAQILETSLADLGYAVEPVQETLFVEGGVMHFQRPGWRDYFVRVRVDAAESTLNFNVVRAKVGSACGNASLSQRDDLLAEDRWCAEFPRLRKTLEARGFTLNVLRELKAGDLPVQQVAPESLPASAALIGGSVQGESAAPGAMPAPARTLDIPR